MKKTFLLLCLLYLSNEVFAQIPKSADSLKVFLETQPQDTSFVLAMNAYVYLLVREGKYAEAEKDILLMEKLSAQYNFGMGFCMATNLKGGLEYTKQNHVKALEHFIRSKQLIEQYHLPKKKLQASLKNIGLVYRQLGDRDSATKYAMQLIDFQEKNQLEPLETSPYQQLGQNLKYYKKYDEARVYFQKMLDLETKYANLVAMAIAENNLGNLFEEMGKPGEALKHFETGLKYAEKKNYKLLQTDLLTNIGRIYTNQKAYDSAESNLKLSEKFCRELEANLSLSHVCKNLGDLYLAQKKYPLAETYYTESLSLAKITNNPDFTHTVNEALASLYKATGDYEKAYQYKLDAEVAKDSAFNIETAKNTEDMLRKYEATKKQQEIALLSKDNRIKDLDLQTAIRNKTLFIILAVIVLGVFLIIFYIRNLRNQNTLQKMKGDLEMKALRSQMNPHFIFNSLNSIQKYIWENKPEDASEYLSKFARLIRLVLENSQYNAIKLNEELTALRIYIEMEHRRNNQKFDYSITVADNVDGDTICIPPLLLQPYVENAIWHGLSPKDDHGKLSITIERERGSLLCCIDDNGIGRSQAAENKMNAFPKTSMATNISGQRIAWLQKQANVPASVTITDKYRGEDSLGTTVLLTLPLVEKYE